MMEFIRKYKIWIAAAAVVIAAAALIFRQAGAVGADGSTAYVETVANLTGQNASLGMINRFAGIIESQGTWSVNKNADVEVEEIYVSEGDEVEEGQALFVYSTTKYEEDLQQAKIDLERLHNEYDSTVETIAQLEKEKKSASSSEQADYTVQIKEQNLTLKDKDLDIQMKEAEIEKLENNIENAEVKSGIAGVVKSINTFYTVLNTVDNKEVSIPNGTLMNSNISNFSSEPLRRVDLTFNIAGSEPVKKVQAAIMKVIVATDKAMADPAPDVEPLCGVPGGLQYTVRVWCKSEDYWNVYFELMREIPTALGSAEIAGPATPVKVSN